MQIWGTLDIWWHAWYIWYCIMHVSWYIFWGTVIANHQIYQNVQSVRFVKFKIFKIFTFMDKFRLKFRKFLKIIKLIFLKFFFKFHTYFMPDGFSEKWSVLNAKILPKLKETFQRKFQCNLWFLRNIGIFVI